MNGVDLHQRAAQTVSDTNSSSLLCQHTRTWLRSGCPQRAKKVNWQNRKFNLRQPSAQLTNLYLFPQTAWSKEECPILSFSFKQLCCLKPLQIDSVEYFQHWGKKLTYVMLPMQQVWVNQAFLILTAATLTGLVEVKPCMLAEHNLSLTWNAVIPELGKMSQVSSLSPDCTVRVFNTRVSTFLQLFLNFGERVTWQLHTRQSHLRF